MKGFRTVIFGVAVAVIPSALDYLAGVQWTSFGISPGMGAAIGVAIVGLRAATNSAIGKK